MVVQVERHKLSGHALNAIWAGGFARVKAFESAKYGVSAKVDGLDPLSAACLHIR